MGLAFTKIWQRLIGKQEMRILMVGHLTFEMLRGNFGEIIFGGKEVVVDPFSALIHLIFLIWLAFRHDSFVHTYRFHGVILYSISCRHSASQ